MQHQAHTFARSPALCSCAEVYICERGDQTHDRCLAIITPTPCTVKPYIQYSNYIYLCVKHPRYITVSPYSMSHHQGVFTRNCHFHSGSVYMNITAILNVMLCHVLLKSAVLFGFLWSYTGNENLLLTDLFFLPMAVPHSSVIINSCSWVFALALSFSQDLATPEAFSRDPSRVWEFYHHRREMALGKSPNAAHYAIAECEARLSKQGRSVVVITQNIDQLHHRAGSKHVLEIHGMDTKSKPTLRLLIWGVVGIVGLGSFTCISLEKPFFSKTFFLMLAKIHLLTVTV